MIEFLIALTLQQQFDADIKECDALFNKEMAQGITSDEQKRYFFLHDRVSDEGRQLFDANTKLFTEAAPKLEAVNDDLTAQLNKMAEQERRAMKMAHAMDVVITSPIRLPIWAIKKVIGCFR